MEILDSDSIFQASRGWGVGGGVLSKKVGLRLEHGGVGLTAGAGLWGLNKPRNSH